MQSLRLGIDASNIRDGGGLGHLREILRVVEPREYGIQQIVVWATRQTLNELPSRPWLDRRHDPLLEQGLPARTYWQVKKLPRLAQADCDCLFIPGGSYYGDFKPFVALSQNLLPFEWKELRRYGISQIAAKLWLLRLTQVSSFRRADGAIFLTQHARSVVQQVARLKGQQPVIPLGIAARFFRLPPAQKTIQSYSESNPFKLLYVSKLEPYKHHWNVVEAVAQLRREGLPVTLELVGAPERQSVLQRLNNTIERVDAARRFVRYVGHVSHQELPNIYHRADGFVFASSCENLPTILLEAMAAGLPIACARRGPMPEVLGEAGLYFDPEKSIEIADAVRTLLINHQWRTQATTMAYQQAQSYSWERCAHETFSLLAEVATRAHSFKSLDHLRSPQGKIR
jgi:glycosyltransferase involved in cell wall biosynthesis